jgi:putative sigma-54 modulation protein
VQGLTDVSDDALVTNGEGETTPALTAPDAPPEQAIPATTATAAIALPAAGLTAALPPPTGLPAAGLTEAGLTAAGLTAAGLTAALPVAALPVAALPVAALPTTAATPAVAPAAPIVVVRPPRPCRIDFEGCTGTEAARVEVRAWLDRLGDLTAPMTGAEVVIESIFEPRKERLYRVRMRLTMRAAVVVVAPDHPNNGPHEDIFCAIRNAFRAARRQLESYQKEHPAADVADPPVTPVPPVSGA